ncbi:hypothetical protein PLICRDRAFT_55623 [Plicaturopsis crispa FD-325 SS-3]|nr:hypothetical protein PLICRDRAFT_55623 [Plicaturopsis crispa FD-325 SS-3]
MADVTLVDSLNLLLVALHLPIELESPQDLTPSLLIALLESLLRTRLPLPFPRSSLLPTRSGTSENDNAVDAIKIFLGVLEHDVIRTDVGLSAVDPRTLARGGWDEVVFVGELLCWFAQSIGILDDGGVETPLPELSTRQRSPTVASTASGSATSVHSSLSVHGIEKSMYTHSSADTSIPSFLLGGSDSSVDDSAMIMSTRTVTPPLTRPPGPRCIHEIDISLNAYRNEPEDFGEDEHVDDTSYCTCDAHAPVPFPVRRAGWISPVDVEREVESFETSRSFSVISEPRSSRKSRTPSSNATTKQKHIITRHTSPTQHTLALLAERARLLDELAQLRRR